MPRIYYLFPVLLLVPFTHDNVSLKVCFRAKQKIWKKKTCQPYRIVYVPGQHLGAGSGGMKPSVLCIPCPVNLFFPASSISPRGIPYCSDRGRRLIIVMKSSSYFFGFHSNGPRMNPPAYLSGSLMWMYRSSEMAHRFRMEAVEHITSNATHVSQNWAPKIQ